MSPPAWLQPDPMPDVRDLEPDELRQLWREHRNDLQGIMAANEIMRRLDAKLLTLEPYPR